MNYCPILGALGFILSEDGTKTLMVHRNKRKKDDHVGKYNGLGGHMERDESASDCIVREIKEEAGIDVLEMKLRGTVNWNDFGPKHEDWMGFIFLITKYSGTPFTENEEGTLHWMDISELPNLPMWSGDKLFLPYIFDGDERVFHGYMTYDNGEVGKWSVNRY